METSASFEARSAPSLYPARIGLVEGAAIGLAVDALIDIIFLAHENDGPDTPRMFSIGGRF